MDKKFKIQKVKNQISLNGHQLQAYYITRHDGEPISRKKMIKFCNEMKDSLAKKYKNGLVSVTIQYPEKNYSSQISYLHEPINFFSMDDYDNFDYDPGEYYSFMFDFIPLKSAKGGSDKNNDCLINCIKKILQSKKNNIIPEELKNYLNLDRDDKIPIELIPQVEKYIKEKTDIDYAINISGDYQYISSVKTLRQINLILSNEHYKIIHDNSTKLSHISRKDRQLIIYHKTDDIECYDGNRFFIMPDEDFKFIMANPITSQHILISKTFVKKNLLKKEYDDLSLVDAHEIYTETANKLKETNEQFFNLYRGDAKHLALNYFYNKNHAYHPDEINNNEASWIENASYGALTYWEPYNGIVHEYDLNSHYPNVMSINNNFFPIKKGEFLTLKDLPDELEFGIYRCIITGEPKKLFKYNQKNYYTSEDIKVARKYNLNIELIIDDQPNFLYYSKDKLVGGKALFYNYVNELYQLKKEKVKGAKILLNILWGALCETNYYKSSVHSSSELELNDVDLKQITHGKTTKLKYTYYNQKFFKTEWARIKPFILSYGRIKLFYRYKRYEDDIVRINTDGFYLSSKPSKILLGDELGELKYEGEKYINLTGLNTGLKNLKI